MKVTARTKQDDRYVNELVALALEPLDIEPELTLAPLDTLPLEVLNANGDLVFRVDRELNFVWGENVSVDDAAREVADAVTAILNDRALNV